MLSLIPKSLKNKRGFVSIYVIIMMAGIIPIFYFLTIDMPHYIQYNRKIKNLVDNMSSSAIVAIDESRLEEGNIYINEQKAKEIINDLLKDSFNLDENLNPKDNSVLKEKPKLEIKFIQAPKGNKTVTTFSGESITVNKTSIILTGEFKLKAMALWNTSVKITKTGVSQAGY